MKPLWYSSLAIILAFSLLTYADCPNCNKNQIPMAGQGPAPDGSGRRQVNVQIDASFNDSPGNTNANIWNGVRDARTDWNNATQNGTPSGQATNYYFAEAQSAPSSNVDVRIVMGNPGTGNLAATGPTNHGNGNVGPPYTITLPPAARNWPLDYLRSVIAHELGHTIGLGHAYKNFSKCGHTIMNHTGANGRVTGSVQPQDVVAANRHYNNRANCKQNWGDPMLPTEGGGYVEPTPNPNLYPRTCYFYWTEVPYYNEGQYMGSVYYLDMVICF